MEAFFCSRGGDCLGILDRAGDIRFLIDVDNLTTQVHLM
ncbi:hypothetical protein C4K16_4171 [Pseudomonas chlororaphis subsp. aurantiaca]|nr:hypothetical protein C4K17_4432 [Pseudomonas chlororaphis subsp. aurantiaca]AZD74523.1 hypothetical protein C4K16_4171 [Pseudomonas chlororaphis subsp. aurantiaca]